MGSDSMMSFMDLIIVAGGLYMLYGYFLLVFKNEIKQGLIISKNRDVSRCKDLEGYKRYLAPKLLAFSVGAILCGGLGLYQTYVGPLPAAVYWVFYGLFLAVLIWFAYSARAAEKKFF